MGSLFISVVVVPGVVALLLFFVFTYLYEQSRQRYFRAWQMGWAAYTLHYLIDGWNTFRQPSAIIGFLASLLLMVMAYCIYLSTRVMRGKFLLRWYDIGVALAALSLVLWNVREHIVDGVYQLQ